MDNQNSKVFLLTGGYDFTIKLWKIQSNFLMKNFSHEEPAVNCLCVGQSRNFFYSGGLQTIRKYDKEASSYPIVLFNNFQRNIYSIKSSLDERWMVSAGEDGNIRIWDLRDDKASQLKISFDNPQNSVYIHPNETLIISAGSDGNVNIWDIRAKNIHSIMTQKDVSCNAITMDSSAKTLAAINIRGICYFASCNSENEIISTKNTSFEMCFRAHDAYGLSCIFSPNSSYFATSSADKTVKIWKYPELSLIQTLSTPKQRWVWDCSFSNDSNFIMTCSSDPVPRLWHTNKGVVIRQFVGHQSSITSMAMSDVVVN